MSCNTLSPATLQIVNAASKDFRYALTITWAVIRVAARSGEMERWEREEKKLHDAKPALDSTPKSR